MSKEDSNNKKYKNRTEDKTIKVASIKSFINAGIQGFTRTNPAFILSNKLRDKLSTSILKKFKKK
tara:strand:- start:79 stop:273 length:195 start_codon:yes stop_codon:yes gene_type:complete